MNIRKSGEIVDVAAIVLPFVQRPCSGRVIDVGHYGFRSARGLTCLALAKKVLDITAIEQSNAALCPSSW
jgi:hypothetical protein